MHIAPNDKGAPNNGADYCDAAKQDRHQQRIVGLLREEQVPRLQNPLPRLCKHALILARRAIWKYASQHRLNFKLETLPKVRAVEKLAPFELVARKAANGRYPEVMTLQTLADVRRLIEHVPAGRRELQTWRHVAAQITVAAWGTVDVAAAIVALRMALAMRC